MTNILEEKINQLMADIRRDIDSGEDRLLLKNYSAEEIVERGFCFNNIQSILRSVSRPDILWMYEDTVKYLPPTSVGAFELEQRVGLSTIEEFIGDVKIAAVRSYLNLLLSNYIIELKSKDKKERN